jgi:hypothetical protein
VDETPYAGETPQQIVQRLADTKADLVAARAIGPAILVAHSQGGLLAWHIADARPGLVKAIAVKVGQEVKAGEQLCIVEAMKMENVLSAERDATVSALQMVTVSSTSRAFTVPLFAGSNSTIQVNSGTSCPAGSPAGAFCASYSLVVPASNPNVGTFSAGKVTFVAPASGAILYTVAADAGNPTSNAAICSLPSQTTNKDSNNQPLAVTPGATTNAARIDFSGCS